MSDIPTMHETNDPIEDSLRYLLEYTEHVRTRKIQPKDELALAYFRDYEVLSLTIQDILEHVQKLKERIEKFEKKS